MKDIPILLLIGIIMATVGILTSNSLLVKLGIGLGLIGCGGRLIHNLLKNRSK